MKIYIDISNYVLARSNTGIQRVVREFLLRLLNKNKLSEQPSFEFNILTFKDKKNKYHILPNNEILLFLDNIQSYTFKKNKSISINDLENGDYFFDMDAAWHNELKRAELYPQLKAQKVFIINFLYDLIPIILPEFTHPETLYKFKQYIQSILLNSDLVLFDSRSAEEDFLQIKKAKKNTRHIATTVIKLGSNLSLTKINSPITLTETKFLSKKYILFVGTLEPRKNQSLMLDIFEVLAEKYDNLHLIFVGKLGWDRDELATRIMSNPSLNKQLHWLDNCTDQALLKLYQSAFLVVYISEYEGYGLPIAESLMHGNITISSKNSSMYEVGKNFADYINYNSINELYEIIALYIEDTQLYKYKKQAIKNVYQAFSWDQSFQLSLKVLNNLERVDSLKQIKIPDTLQFIFISINTSHLTGTIRAIDKHINFVKEYIVVTQAPLVNKMQSINSLHTLTVIDENSILGDYSNGFSARDHVAKNWLLRCSLLNIENLDNEFIMLDDDNRPIIDISIDFFINNNRCYNAYYFYSLLNWNEFSSDYDLGQQNMKKVLDQDGLELLSYSSHMPQIINKNIWQEVVDEYFKIGLIQSIDEWSMYFNYAVSKYPTLFNKKIFETLNWPAQPCQWDMEYIPKHYSFENYYHNEQFAKNNISSKQKINKKIEEIKPYTKTKELMKSLYSTYKQKNMVHGQMVFQENNIQCILSNIPYFIAGIEGTFIKLAINFKILNNVKRYPISIYYIIDREIGGKIKIPVNYHQAEYAEDIINLPIYCPKKTGDNFNLLFDIEINGQSIYADNSPYLVKLMSYKL